MLSNSPKLSVRLHGGLTAVACVDLAKQAEKCGYHGVWLAENPFARGVLPAAAAIAASTSRILIGPGVFNPFNRHPTLMAMEIGALDELAAGRARLGLGAGISGAVERMGFKYDRPLTAVHDAVTIMRGLLSGDAVQHEGRVFSSRGAKLEFRTRADIPIFVAGRGEKSLELVGRIGDGLLVSNMCTPAFAARAAATVNAARATAGRSGTSEVVQYMPVCVNPDRKLAIKRAIATVAEMLPGFWATGKRLSGAKDAMLEGSGISDEEFETASLRLRAGEQPSDVLDERFAAVFTLSGTAEECLARASAFAERGVTELALTFSGNTAPQDMAYLANAG